MINFRKEIQDLLPYKPGKPIEDVQREYGLTSVDKLASNENPLGCSPKVKEAIIKASSSLNLYPDGNATEFKELIASKNQISVDMILPGAGSDEIVDIIAKAYLNPGDKVIMADITFPRYISVTKMMGAVPVIVPLKEHTYDLDAMKAKLTEDTRLVWLCNPNNPTGTMVSDKAIYDFIESVPRDTLIVYDEAYREYVTREDYIHDSIDLIKKYPNVIVLRTFSKVYGLAALRVGYAISSPFIINELNRIRNPFNCNMLAQIAAMAAYEDQDFVKESYIVNKEGKEYIQGEFERMGIEYAPSETNHVYFKSMINSNELFIALQKQGMIIRPITPDYARVSIGTMEQNKRFIKLLSELI